MPRIVFWDVDTQVDFMHADGALYVPDAEQLVSNLRKLTNHAHSNGIRVIASADAHQPDDEELSTTPDYDHTYPPHCVQGTLGQTKIPETALSDPLEIDPEVMDHAQLKERIRHHSGDILFNKHKFDVFTNPNVEPVLEELDPQVIVLYGVALDVCNRFAIEGLLARYPGVTICVVLDATKAIAAENTEGLVEGWRKRGVRLIVTEEALRMGVTGPSEADAG